jgi:hypothetical protein
MRLLLFLGQRMGSIGDDVQAIELDVGTQFGQHFFTGHAGHADVEQNNVEALVFKLCKAEGPSSASSET